MYVAKCVQWITLQYLQSLTEEKIKLGSGEESEVVGFFVFSHIQIMGYLWIG